MGLTQAHALGERGIVFASTQTSLADFTAKPTTGDAFKILKMEISHEPARKPRMDNKQTRSLLEQITGKTTASWSLDKYLLPSGTGGTPPDDDLLWTAVMGAGAAGVYTLTNSQTVDILRLDRELSGVMGQVAFGSIVDEMTLTVTGGDDAKLKFGGPCVARVHTGTSTLNGDVTTAEIIVQSADAQNFDVGSLISVGSTDNLMIIGADRATATFTVDTTVTELDGSVVKPYVPTETTAGVPLTSLSGFLKLDGTNMPITGFDVTVKNNHKPIMDEAFQDLMSDVIVQDRMVTGNFTVRARKDLIVEIGNRAAFATRDISVRIGQTAGSILTIDFDYAEIGFAPEEVPEVGEAMIKLPFTALGSSGEDEATFTFS